MKKLLLFITAGLGMLAAFAAVAMFKLFGKK